MSHNLKLILGALAGAIIGGITVVGANQTIQAIQNTAIKISLNGQTQEFKDETTGEVQYPITYHDRTYLPLRNVAQLAGMNVDYDSNTNTAILKGNSNKCVISSPYGNRYRKEREYTTYKNNYLISLIRDHYNENAVESQLIIEYVGSVAGETKKEYKVAMNEETSEFLYEIKDDGILVTKYMPFPDVEKRSDFKYKLFRVDYKISADYGTFHESIISIDLGDNMLTNKKPSETLLNESSEILNNNKDKIKNSSEFFVTNSVHITTPTVNGAYVGELYYFDEDGTYYWGASEYYNDQDYVASTGTWEIANDKLILHVTDMLFLKGGKLVPQSNPNGTSENELIDYKETIVWGPAREDYQISLIDNNGNGELNSHEYKYVMDGKTWYSNANIDMDDNLWIKKLKVYKEKYKFLGDYSYANESGIPLGYNTYINFYNIEEFSITLINEGEERYTISGTYEVDDNQVICTFNNCIIEQSKESLDVLGSKLTLKYNNEEFEVVDWQYKSGTTSNSYDQASFIKDCLYIGEVFRLIIT